MGLLKLAEIEMAFAKVGIFGFQGTGKTFTGTLIALGILDLIGQKKLAFYDTETGSDFVLDRCKAAGVEMMRLKSRSFKDLCNVIDECENDGIPLLLADSMTHVWRNLVDGYMKKNNIKKLEFQHWGALKGPDGWQQFTDRFINSNLHMVVCGRAGYEYDYSYNEDGTKDLVKTGTKMKAETEFGFEPSLVIEMERLTEADAAIQEIEDSKADRKEKKKQKQAVSARVRVGSAQIHRAYVLKDRWDVIDGKHFDNPIFKDFLPHIEKLNLGGVHLGLDTTRDQEDKGLFDDRGKGDWSRRRKEEAIVREEIVNFLKEIWPSSGQKDANCRLDYLESAFGVRSWAHVEEKVYLADLKKERDILDLFRIRYAEIIQEPSIADLSPKDQIIVARNQVSLEVQKAKTEEGKPEDDFPI